MKEYKGDHQVDDISIAIVVSRFNEVITKRLLEGALYGLKSLGVKSEDITVVHVPGACEIPIVTKKLAISKTFNSIICLGAVIKGATSHFDYVCSQVSDSIAKLNLDFDIPILFGVLTCDNAQQAFERSDSKNTNKGYDCALGAIEMVNLMTI